MIKNFLFKEIQVSNKILLAVAIALVVAWISGLYALNKTMAQIVAPPGSSSTQWTCHCCRPSVSAAQLIPILIPSAPAEACDSDAAAQSACDQAAQGTGTGGIYRVSDKELINPGEVKTVAAGTIFTGNLGAGWIVDRTDDPILSGSRCIIACEPIETGDRTCKTPPGQKTGTGSGLAAASANCDAALDQADPLPANHTGRRSVQWCERAGDVTWQCALPQTQR